MSDIKKLLETMDRMAATESKSTGPKFPGYWKGTDPASKAKDKMVGGCEENILKDLNNTAKEKVTEWRLQEKFDKFKEQQNYTGIDPIVRQRMGMEPATQDEIRTYLDKNPPVVQTRTGEPVRSGSGTSVGSAGQIDVAKAADAVSPDREQSVAKEPKLAAPVATPAAPVATPAAPVATPAAPVATAVAAPIIRNVPVGSAALDPAQNPDAATNIPGGQSAGGPGVVPTSTKSSSTSAPYRGNRGARDIQSVNPSIKDVNKIYPGQRLKLPDSDEDYVVQKGDTLDKIGNMYRQGEIGGRVISTTQGGEPIPPQTPPAPAARPQPATPASAGSTAPSSSPTAPATRARPAAPAAPAAPASTATQTSSASPTARSMHPSGTRVTTQIRDPQDPTKPLSIQLKKGDDGSWYDDRGRKLNFDKPGDLEKLENLPADAPTFMDKVKRVFGGELPSRVFGQPRPQQNRPEEQPAAPAKSSQTSQPAMASYPTKGGRVYAADFNNPSGLGWDGKGKYTSFRTPEEGVNATRDLVSSYLTDKTPYIKGSPTPEQVVSTWVSGGATPAEKIQGGRYLQSVKDELAAAGVKLDDKGRIPYSQAARDAITRAIIRHETHPKHIEKFTPFLNSPQDKKISESNKEDEKIAGLYDPDEFDLMVKRLGQKAKEQDRKHGPVDLSALAKRLRDIEKRQQTKEQEDPAVNMQDPDVQKTSQTSPQQDPTAVKQQQLDQTVDIATAKGTVSGLKNVLGPDVDTNALASAVTKISDGKPLTGPESTSMSALTPLISKAAETPQTAMALKTALSNAGMLAKQGK
jgi:hypothetical protein